MEDKKTPRGYSTVNVHTVNLADLSIISAVTGKDKSQILNEFIEALYQSVFPHITRALAEKKKVAFDYQIFAGILPEFVFGSRKIDMAKSNKQLDKEMFREIDRKFAELDQKKEKEIFDKATTHKIKLADVKLGIRTKEGKKVKPE